MNNIQDMLAEIMVSELDRVDNKYQAAVLGTATIMLAIKANAIDKEAVSTLIILYAKAVDADPKDLISDADKVLMKFISMSKS